MDPIAESDRLVANVKTGTFLPFDSAVPGMSVLQVDHDAPFGAGFHIFRMEPGTTTTPHEHTSNEQFFVIEGDIVDHDGVAYGPGDIVCLRKGTKHSSYSENGCLLVVHLGTPERPLEAGE